MKLKSLLTTLAAAVGLTSAATAVTPVVTWDGDFGTTTKGNYTLNANGNAVASDGSTITIDQTKGVLITATGTNPFGNHCSTTIIKFSGYANPSSGAQALVADTDGNPVYHGITAQANGNAQAIWGTSLWGSGKITDGSFALSADTTHKLVFAWRRSSGSGTETQQGTKFYLDGTQKAYWSGLFGQYAPTGVVIGGPSDTAISSVSAATGMKIEAIAIFDSALSKSDIDAYQFPSEQVADCNATIEANADIDWTEIVWDNEPTATSTVLLTLEGNAKITVTDAAACGAITVKGTGTLTLDAGNNLTSEKITSKIPLVITTAKNQTVDAGSNDLTYNYTGAAMASTVINVTSTGNLTFGGTSEFKYTATIPQGTTFTVADTCKVNYYGNASQSIQGNVVIASGATFVNKTNNDILGYNYTVNVHVYGTLDMSDTRWTLGSKNTIYVYPGANVIGAGHSDYKAFDYFGNQEQIKFSLGDAESGTATLTAGLRQRRLPIFDIPAGMTIEFGSEFSTDGSSATGTFVKKGDGVLKILDSLRTNSKVSMNITAGTLDLSAMTDKATTNQISQALTVSEGVAIRFPEGFTEDDTFTLCGGTLTAEATVRKATVYIGDATTPVENATLIYDAENKTVAYTTKAAGSITISGNANIADIIAAVAAQEGEEYAEDVMVTMDAGATLTVEKTFAYPKMTIVSTGAIAIDYQLDETDTYAKIDLVNVAGDLTITTSVALPIAAGARNLTYNYNGADAITNTTISTDGTFTKGGTGAIKINLGASRTAATYINEGTLLFATQKALGNGAPITVNAGGTLDFNGCPNGGDKTTVILNGGTMKNGVNSGGNIGQMQIKSLTLTADSTIDTPYEFGMVGSQYGATTIELGTFTLTKKGEGTFHVATATISGTGKIRVEAGTLDFFKNSTFENGTVELAGGTLNRAANLTAGAVTVTADSAITGGSNLTAPITISNGATLDCTAISLPIADVSLAAAQDGSLKVTTPATVAKIAVADATVEGITLVDENGEELTSCTFDGYFWYGELGETYTFTEEEQTAISALTQGAVFSKQTMYVNVSNFIGTPEGCFAWAGDDGFVHAAKKSNSISIKFTPASANEGTIAASDENVGGYPVAGTFWNHSKVSTKTGVGGDGVTEIFALKDGNGEALDGVLCYYFMQNMYDVNQRSTGGRNQQTTGNGKLTYSYFDDTDGLTPDVWPYSVGTYEEREYVLPATPVKEGVTANLRWEVAITNIPYQVFDLYLYQASDQTSETIKLLPLAVKANDGDWHYFAGDNAGSTVVATYDTTWNGACYCDDATMTEGTHYIRYRMSKAALGLGDDETISVVYLSHPKRHDGARLGLAGVQIVEVANDGYYTRNAACESADWLATGGWLNSSSSEITWTNPTGTDVAYATIDADAVSEINIDGEVVANEVKLTNTAPEEGEGEKSFTFTASEGGTLTAPVDATGFYGKVIPCEGMTSSIALGDNAYIEVNVAADQTVAIENILPSGVTVVGGTVKIVGEGTVVCDGAYPTAYATSFQNADTWKGTVWLKNVELSGAGMSNYGNTNSTIKATGVAGWIWSGDQGIANLELADEGDKIAYSVDDTSGGWTYSFAKLTGNGTFKYSTQAASSAGVAIGDVSEFTGAILSTYGVHHSTTNITTPRPIYIGTTNAVAGSKSLISVVDGATINAGCGWEAGSVAFGANLTVKGEVGDVIVSNVTNEVPVLATKVTLDGKDGIYCLAYADGKVSVADAVAFTVADCDNATFTVSGAFKNGESYYAPANAAITVTYTATSGYTFPSTGTGTLVVNGTATSGGSFSAGEKPVAPGVPYIFTIAEGEEGAWTLDGTVVTKAVVDADTSREIWKQGTGSMTNVVINRTYVVKEGTMVAGNAKNLTGTVTIDSGATFDFNGKVDGYTTFNLNGGTFVNNGGAMGTGSRQIEDITLTADSTIGGTGTFGMSSNSHHANALDLGGFTLTKKDANTFFLCNTTVTNGNVNVTGGTLQVVEATTFTEATLTLGEGTTLDNATTLNIGAINADGATINNTGTITPFTLTGSATLTGNGNWGTNTLANGASVNVGTKRDFVFAGAGTVNVTLTDDEVADGAPITVFTLDEGATTVLGAIMYNGKDIADKCTVEDNKITAIEKPEAKIGTTYYFTLAEALDAAEDEAEITLLKDVTFAPDGMYTINKTIYLTLGGYKLTGNGGKTFEVVNDGLLSFDAEGSTVTGVRVNVGKATNDNGSLWINGGTWTIDDNTLVHVNGTCSNCTVYVQSATMTSNGDNAIQLCGAGSFTINGGTITGATAVYAKAGEVSISANLVANGEKKDYEYSDNGANATGDALVIDNCGYPEGPAKVSILEGTLLSSANGDQMGYYVYNSSEEGTVTKGATVEVNAPAGYGWDYGTTLAKMLKYYATVYANGQPYTWAGLGTGDAFYAKGVTVDATTAGVTNIDGQVYYVSKLLRKGDPDDLVCEFEYDGTTLTKKDGATLDVTLDGTALSYQVTTGEPYTLDSLGHACIGGIYYTAYVPATCTFTLTPDIAGTTVKVYTNDTVEVTKGESGYTVLKDAEVKIVYTADQGKLFADGTDTKTLTKTISENGEISVSGEVDEPTDAKAKIGDVYYLTLQAAIDAAKADDTVTLLDEITLTSTITLDKAIMLDLGVKGVVCASTCATAFKVTSTVTIDNGSVVGPDNGAGFDGNAVIEVDGENAELTLLNVYIGATGTDSDGMYGVYVLNGGTLIAGDGNCPDLTIDAHFAAIGANNTTSPTTITINEGEYSSYATTDSEWWHYFCAAIYAPGNGTLTINGGTFYGGRYSIASRYANVDQTITIDGGSFGSPIFVDDQTGIDTGVTVNRVIKKAESVALEVSSDSANYEWGEAVEGYQTLQKKPTTYTITITEPTNGTLETSVTNNVVAGTTVTVTATPAEGYTLESITTNGTAITGTTFDMPAEDVTVAATFKAAVAPVKPGEEKAYDSEEEAKAATNNFVVAAATTSVKNLFNDDPDGFAAYQAMFEPKITQSGEKYVVTAEFKPEVAGDLQTAVNTATTSIEIGTIAAEDESDIEVSTTVKGLFYQLDMSDDVTDLQTVQEVLSPGGAITFESVGKPSTEKGFYRISVSAVPKITND